MIEKEQMLHFLKTFNICTPLFIALADKYRQQLVLDIIDAGKNGMNVTNLTAKSKLSRPAISHHLKILKDAEIIYPDKIGTQIFYKVNVNEKLLILRDLIDSVQVVVNRLEKFEETENSEVK
ncbi:MAG: winged helix-turn-helix transcriptional regulator [Treponema sp.]|nr:winged helix-turn-helix transcriptional regulator [Candidatus Treponema merdequi]